MAHQSSVQFVQFKKKKKKRSVCPQEATILGTPSGLHDVASGQVDVQISDYFAAERC